ncbi:unnamed protein product [Vicia faba]|uniref:Uncharacterized protein n=1 Tax=Vicia faba TaxID=3906 RepID=A0AAV0ZZQ9_VICFA|nr:unnamed protein product [Vicia faba]
MTQFEELAEGCISTILSRTTPVDAGRFSVISKTFHSAADSDAALYLALSDRPIIVDNGLKSFQLDRKSGKICYMLGARSLSICWVHDERYWKWITMRTSRFPEAAKLLNVCWLEICGTINTIALSPNTEYAAYLVFKMVDPHRFQIRPAELSVFVEGGHSSTKNVCLDPNVDDRSHNRVVGLQCPNVRSDGWLEIEMGEFFNSGIENEEVHMKVLEKGAYWKRGLIVEGIEIRPK